MKKARKGFTLVELLIVIAILATLTASMTMSMQGATAKAKASTIAANLDACRSAAMLYYASSMDVGLSTVTADTMLAGNFSMWSAIKGVATDPIRYGSSGSGPNAWVASVDFSLDPDKTEITNALKKIKGYKNITGNVIKVTLLSGKIEN